MPEPVRLVGERVDHLDKDRPTGVGQDRRARGRGPPGSLLATGREVQGQTQDIAAALVQQA